MATKINTEIKINCSPERVWKMLTEFEKYPEWNPFIISLTGIPKVGNNICATIISPNNKEMTFKPKVLKFKNEKELRWKGKLLFKGLFDGEHYFKLIANDDNSTTFVHGEIFTGLLVPLLKKQLSSDTMQGFIDMNKALKEKCEN